MHADGNAPHCALLFGHHELLLETRNRLLAIIGCDSKVTLTLRDFHTYLLRHPVELVVLCQSSTAAERAEAVAIAIQYRPQARVLMLCSPTRWCEPGQDTTELDAMAGPAQFLQAARQLLASPAVGHA